jgi:hypothetical protein
MSSPSTTSSNSNPWEGLDASVLQSIQKGIQTRFDEVKIRQWCIEQAVKTTDCTTAGMVVPEAKQILDWITQPFEDILKATPP